LKTGLLAVAIGGGMSYMQYLNGGDPKAMWTKVANDARIDVKRTVRKSSRSVKALTKQAMNSLPFNESSTSKGFVIPGSGGEQLPVSLNQADLKQYLEHAQRPSTER